MLLYFGIFVWDFSWLGGGGGGYIASLAYDSGMGLR